MKSKGPKIMSKIYQKTLVLYKRVAKKIWRENLNVSLKKFTTFNSINVEFHQQNFFSKLFYKFYKNWCQQTKDTFLSVGSVLKWNEPFSFWNQGGWMWRICDKRNGNLSEELLSLAQEKKRVQNLKTKHQEKKIV